MIIDFTIQNFRSIKKEQTFSFYAQKSLNHHTDNIAYPDGGKIGVLRTSGIYGANASGKSNMLLAFEALRFMICRSGELKEGDIIEPHEPFRLSKETINAPTVFEIEFFTIENVRFIYKIEYNSTEIIFESLDFYPSIKKANIFTRYGGLSWKDVKFGSSFKGGKKQFAFFSNNSYLSKAGNSADAPDIIRTVYNFFRKNLLHLEPDENFHDNEWKNDAVLINKMAKILTKVDTGITGIELKENSQVKGLDFPSGIPESLKKRIISDLKLQPWFNHKTEDGDVELFSENMESSGTRKLFNMLPLLMKTFEKGSVLILDEIDQSYHSHLAELIIKLFNNPLINRNNAQLIFSTHNLNLMSPQIFRRDQIWFAEKLKGATTFYSLDQYDKDIVKSNSPFGKWYEEGRFGAIPNIDIKTIANILKGV
ncbi:ATP-binding protein [Colwellia sp. 6_MG-2023]|uniref:AAA family ATPase n=1 Tax=Colwellia sp. 6_MG-2023 TaxID=3062676 RepID=UPI0026E472BA|nr:ATP-binding protein [Colwellia sp. 6_MG-2023]MDO6487886.1 ATP-binding protein [Colwellia sp. 6_MG-2023]